MPPKTKKLTETVEKINEKHGEKVVVTAKEISSKKDETPEKSTSGQDNNCYIDFSSADKSIVAQNEKICKESVFEVLSKVNVNDKVETKNNMKYLSWAFAWSETKKRFPSANYKVYETDVGVNYFTDGKTCWVKVGVTIEGLEHIEYLPIMNFRNQSILVGQVTSCDVNKAIQRGLTKAIARHGLGLYIYAGEDLPEEEKDQNDYNKIRELYDLLNLFGEKEEKLTQNLLKKYEVEKLTYLKKEQVNEAIEILKNFKEKEVKTA